jgi:hypothetical protein
VAIVHNRPELLSLKDLLSHFLEHRREVILRRTRYELKQAEARAHILAGLLMALNYLDQVIALIRAAANPAAAKEQLMAGSFISAAQPQLTLEETRASSPCPNRPRPSWTCGCSANRPGAPEDHQAAKEVEKAIGYRRVLTDGPRSGPHRSGTH